MNPEKRSELEKSALLASVAAGTATQEERREAEAMAQDDPDAAARLALSQSACEATRRITAEAEDNWTPGEIGLRRLMREIDREQESARLGWVDSVAVWRGVAAAAMIALVALSAWKVEDRRSDGGYELASGRSDQRAPAQITFAPSATEAEIRALLISVNGRIADGPSALGVYRLAFESPQARDAALAKLKSTNFVESASAE